MSDTIETTVTPDPRAIAHAVLLEVADEPEQVGEFVVANELEDHVTDFRFAANIRGYEGWQWSVTLYHDMELDSWTVNESSLIPTEDALLPPKWIPWKDRLEPTDLSPTDSIGTEPDDERLETGELAESSLEDVNDAAETFRLTRRHVLSPLGRAQAAKRWYEGPRGPKALSTKTADGNLCSDCGFFVPLMGELDRMFGVCANKWSPDDGRVVSLDHGCGEHSEIEPPEPSHLWVQSKPALDDLHIDIVAHAKPRKAEPEPVSEDEVEETASESEVDETQQSQVADIAVEPDANDVADIAENTEPVESAESEIAEETAESDVDAQAAEVDDDEATEEDILNNTSIEDDEDDEEDDDIDDEIPETTADVAPELETVIDLIEQLRQSRAEAESEDEAETDTDTTYTATDTDDDEDNDSSDVETDAESSEDQQD